MVTTDQNQRIVTFYSYKGGAGRSMALANIAWILAANGKRVLAIDWDFEAPGLHRYFLPFLADPELSETPGLIDLLWDYVDLAMTDREAWPPGIDDVLALADPQRYAVPLEFPFEVASSAETHSSCLHFLPAGLQNDTYAAKVHGFDWPAFYKRWGGETFLETFKSKAREHYDFVLIDSRTGIADTSGICTIQMPDTVVFCFTYNRQSVQGIESVGHSIRNHPTSKHMRFLPVPMRVEKSASRLERARRFAHHALDPLLPSEMTPDERLEYWYSCEISHYSDYAWEETLAVIKEEPRSRGTLIADLIWLTEQLAGHPLNMPRLSQEDQDKFLRRSELGDADRFRAAELIETKQRDGEFDVFLFHNSQDKPAVRVIAERLRQRGILPWFDEWEIRPGMPWQEALERQIGRIKAAAIFVGRDGLAKWQNMGLEVLLQDFVSHHAPVIPVILPNAPEILYLPSFLKVLTVVDFRLSDPDPMEMLIWGITGKRQQIRALEKFP